MTGPYADVPFFLDKKGDEEGGSWDVRSRRAVIVGTGEEKVSLVACEEYVSPSYLISRGHYTDCMVDAASANSSSQP